jgi:hypothetical protein
VRKKRRKGRRKQLIQHSGSQPSSKNDLLYYPTTIYHSFSSSFLHSLPLDLNVAKVVDDKIPLASLSLSPIPLADYRHCQLLFVFSVSLPLQLRELRSHICPHTHHRRIHKQVPPGCVALLTLLESHASAHHAATHLLQCRHTRISAKTPSLPPPQCQCQWHHAKGTE